MNVGVIGSGIMGTGISFICAAHGHKTVVVDLDPRQLEKAKEQHQKMAHQMAKKQNWEEQRIQETLKRLSFTRETEALKEAEIVVEAVVEEEEVKKKIFTELEKLCSPETILGTNTSSLSITRLSSSLQRKERLIGIHFFNPAHLMALVELIRGVHTSDACFNKAKAFADGLGKVVVESKDSPGFITSRLGVVLILEAIFCYQEGIATKEDIDTAMKLGYNHPMGPLRLADLVGLDTILHVSQVLYESFQDPKYRPPWLLKQMVAAGKLGKKSGEGFYVYSGN